ncbi:MAG: DUF192 domain-containing protein [Sulfurimicrobium sp.]|nr:DUF192 domain-containing protein [Sulfurimicrobium sp.]
MAVKVSAVFMWVVVGVFLMSGLAIFPVHAKDSCVPVHFVAAKESFCLEVADTFASREAGLQNRDSIPSRGGMIFVFPENAPRVFWMKDTLLELDILFLDGAGVVRGLVTRVPPGPIKLYAPARYVIELPGGTGEALGLWPGDKVLLPKRLTRSIFK